MSQNYRIIIAEDHTILRDGLRALLSGEPGLEVCGEAEDGHQAVQLVDALGPDLVLMDLAMPRMHGLEALREISRRSPDTRLLVLTVHKNDEYILAALQAGAHGYVLKDASQAELKMAIKTVLAGKRYLSPGVSELVIEGYLEGKLKLRSESSYDTLTAREREILKLIAEGNKNKDIAALLCISIKTVERHRANLMKKLGCHNVSQLTTIAINKGLVAA